MKIPETVKVGGVVYDVIPKSFIELDGDRNYQGLCDFQNTKISILSSISDERIQQTFFHELTHAIFYEAGFEQQDEDVINRIGIVLHQVISDNFIKDLGTISLEVNGDEIVKKVTENLMNLSKERLGSL